MYCADRQLPNGWWAIVLHISLMIATYDQTKFNKLVQGAYRDEMIRRHGPDCDWRHMPIDAQAVHASSGGKAHGR